MLKNKRLEKNETEDRRAVAQRPDETTTGALTTRILTAWGDQDTVTYHGDNFAKGQVILYGGVENSNPDPIAGITSDPGIAFFDVNLVRGRLC